MKSQKRSGRGGRLVVGTGVVGLIVAAVLYLRCGDGFGFGRGDGTGKAKEVQDAVEKASTQPAASLRPCQLRLDGAGLSLGDRRVRVEEAVRACKETSGAELVATGDAVYGELERLRETLERAGVKVFVRHPGAASARESGAAPR